MVSSDSAPAEASSTASVEAYNPATTAMPASVGTETTGSSISTAGGSVDTCGSNGGQTCKTGMCCSAHGYVAIPASTTANADEHLRYCGTMEGYCGSGCQSQFGNCSGPSKYKRRHMRRQHGHIFRSRGLHL